VGGFIAALSNAMHAMAQPMTLIRSHFYLVRAGGPEVQLSQTNLDDAEAAMEKLCTIFRLTQQLVRLQGAGVIPMATPLSAILNSLVEDAEAVFAGTRLRLDLTFESEPGKQQAAVYPGDLPLVESNSKFTRQALLSMLQVLRDLAEAQTDVSCHVSIERQWAVLNLSTAPSLELPMQDRLTELTRLQIALANAAAVSQGADFGLDADLSALFLKLPLTGEQA
jgi:hypothetical protein